jgi:MFS family permease
MGNVLGPFMAAAFIERATWRALFWLITPVSGVVGLITYFILPSVKPTDGMKEKVKKIDYLGIITSAVALIFLLIPISGGGSYFKWNSSLVIALLSIGIVSAVLFILVEWKLARLPMMPRKSFPGEYIDMLMANGKISATLSQPCRLRYSSPAFSLWYCVLQ